LGISASYTQVSESSFKKIKEQIQKNQSIELDNYKKDNFYIEKSFFGLQFILIKGLGNKLDKAFEGEDYLCNVNYESEEFKKLSFDERFEIFETTSQESYLSPERILELSELTKNLNAKDIEKWYDSEELNRNQIYPEVWHNDEAQNKVFNLRDLKECFNRWKDFINKVAENKTDYIIVR
jgi:hypothetical protein